MAERGFLRRIREWIARRPDGASAAVDPDSDLASEPRAGGRRRFQPLERRAREALSDFGTGVIDTDEHLYRDGGASRRDLDPSIHERQIRLAYAAYTTTPLGKRAIELTTDYVVGDGLSWEVEESAEKGEPSVEEVAEVLERHWNDATNAWSLKARDRVTALGLWGEQCWPVFVEHALGQVKIGNVDPQRIAYVEIDAENAERTVAVRLKRQYAKVAGEPSEGRRYSTIEIDPEDGYLKGAAFYWAVNRVPGATRGHSDLMHVLDWIESYDDLLFNSIDAARLRAAITWDVLCKGASDADIAKKRGALRPPPPGGALVHNESEIWTPVSPDIGAAQHDVFSRMVRVQILGGLGIPEHWFGEGDSATRATAVEMAAPVLRRLKARQEYVLHAVREVLRFTVDQAILAGAIKGTAQTKDRVKVTAPPFERRDLTAAASALAQTTSALSLAETQKWVTRDTARKAFASVVAGLGVEIDPEAEAEQLEDAEGADAERAELEAQRDAALAMAAKGEDGSGGGDEDDESDAETSGGG